MKGQNTSSLAPQLTIIGVHASTVRAFGSYEYQIYTDARMTGEVTQGLDPYQFFNLVPLRHLYQPRGTVTAAITLRVSSHIDVEGPPMDKTDQARYHGGWIADEIAARASLKCGVRCRAGGQTRRFERGDDPHGRPLEWFTRPGTDAYCRYWGIRSSKPYRGTFNDAGRGPKELSPAYTRAIDCVGSHIKAVSGCALAV